MQTVLIKRFYSYILSTVVVLSCLSVSAKAQAPVTTPYPIMFVTQVPVPADFTTIGSTFGNHRGTLASVTRGGDLWMRYPSGTLKNLTALAGFGATGFQGANGIAVRDPSVHWSGQKALFSMVIGGATQQFQVGNYFWKIYEVTGLGETDTPVITLVPNQPTNVNNITPVYGSDGRIIFTSDRPRNGAQHLYPQRDEYEVAPTVSGIWSLDPSTGDLDLLNHAPSGDFTPIVDSFGRIIFTQWDHLQRDQLADGDAFGAGYGMFNWSSEAVGSTPTASTAEVYPEPRPSRPDLLAGTNMVGHTFNHFFPWQLNQDGTELETLNHIGRHEFHTYFTRSFNDDPNLDDFVAAVTGRTNTNNIEAFFQIKEDPTTPGRYIGTDAPEFTTHAAGQIVGMTMPPGVNPDQVLVQYVTHRDTRFTTETPGPNHSGLYRDPLPISDGSILAVHTPETRIDTNIGTSTSPASRYDFRIKKLVQNGVHFVAGDPLTPGITESITYWSPDQMRSFSGQLWELQPVEVRPRPMPPFTGHPQLATPEAQAFAEAGVSPESLRAYLEQNDLALIVSRNVTTRDQSDEQQPYNLRIAGTSTQTIGSSGQIYDVSHMQIFQGDLLRGIGGLTNPQAGRRVIAQPMHDLSALAVNPSTTGPTGSVALGADGSMAAFVPARRALTWQLTDPTGDAVVRERYWLTFQPGEIRVCASCHGVNTNDQAGQFAPANKPEALVTLLANWQSATGPTLGANAAGTVVPNPGGSRDVLTIDGFTGGAGRRVDIAQADSALLAMAQPPTASGPQPFALWGTVGVPGAFDAYPSPLGTFLFLPKIVDPLNPTLFTIANSIFPDPSAILPAGPASWSYPLPPIPLPLTVTLQGAIADPSSPTSGFSITNGVILRVQ